MAATSAPFGSSGASGKAPGMVGLPNKSNGAPLPGETKLRSQKTTGKQLAMEAAKATAPSAMGGLRWALCQIVRKRRRIAAEVVGGIRPANRIWPPSKAPVSSTKRAAISSASGSQPERTVNGVASGASSPRYALVDERRSSRSPVSAPVVPGTVCASRKGKLASTVPSRLSRRSVSRAICGTPKKPSRTAWMPAGSARASR